MSYLPFVEKYRPTKFEDIISNNENIKILKNMLKSGSLPHLLFHGTSGVGKTSAILALAKELYGNSMNLIIMKLDASDDRGINSVRDDIKGFAEKKNMFQKGTKLIILDEADSMTFDAQFALRRIIEKYSDNTRFCLICNYENKIIPAIRSRCANFKFSPIDKEEICTTLKKISIQENIKICDKSLGILSQISNGDLRKGINFLQSISMRDNNITPELCYETTCLLSLVNLNIIYELLFSSKSFLETYNELLNIIKKNGYSLHIIIRELCNKILESIDSFSHDNLANLLCDFSDLENKISKSMFQEIYISSMISIVRIKNIQLTI
jgi:replication factor C subunit 3/5